jgi:hypothetical protein
MNRAGVRTVVAGGRLSAGPMQVAAGIRGDMAYNANALDNATASWRIRRKAHSTKEHL